MKNILVVIPTNERHREQLTQAAGGCRIQYTTPAAVTREQVLDAECIVGNVPSHYIQQSPKLKLLQLNSAGTDQYIAPGVLAKDTILTNATGAYGKSVAEHMFAMMLVLQKKLHLYRDDRFSGKWNDHGTITSPADSRVIVIGLGDIGTHFAGMAKALGAYVIGVKRRPGICPQQADELLLMSDLERVLPTADVVLSVLPNTPATRGIYDKHFFAGMKKTGIFLNAGRGNAVNQNDLLQALQEQQIAGAGIDVTDPEPLPADHPLWQEPQIMITPHVSGQYHLPETLDRIVGIAAENISAYLNGRPLRNVVDFETGYCK